MTGIPSLKFFECIKSLQPIHDRHFEVEHDDVRLQYWDLIERNFPVGCSTYNLKHTVFCDDVTEKSPHNDSVVDDQDTDGNHRLTRQAEDLQLFSNHFLGKRFHKILVCPGFECLSHL